jgi:Plasmid encoded RepA protein
MDTKIAADSDTRTNGPEQRGSNATKHELELVRIATEVEFEDAAAAGTVGYMGRLLVQATLPHSKPDDNEFLRRNGNTVLHMMAPRAIGLPYGGQPRLALGFITTEVVKTGNRVVSLGHTKRDFLKRLGKGNDGGKKGAATAMDKQLVRLVSTSIRSFTDTEHFTEIAAAPPVVKRWTRWWSPKSGLDQAGLSESEIEIGEEFFRAIIERPVPVDLRVLAALSKSPLAMDLYCALTHRVSYLRRSTMIPWRLLMQQFGANYGEVKVFRFKAIKALKTISLFWPELRWAEEPDQDGRMQFVLHPSRPHVLMLPSRRR